MHTSISKQNDANKHQARDSNDGKHKYVFEISPWYFASNVHQECIGLEQSKCACGKKKTRKNTKCYWCENEVNIFNKSLSF